MDTNFQTSFIPKKPLAEERVVAPTHTSLYSFIATLIFFASLAAGAGVYFYQASLAKSLTNSQSELAIARNSFEPTRIAMLEVLDRRITDSKQLLAAHVAVSPIFAALEADTLKSVQFTKFSYVTPADPSAPVTVRMSGRAKDYATIALQSDQLGTNKDIHNPLFSNLTLDSITGNVGFDLVFTVSADLVRFKAHVPELSPQPAVTSVETTVAPSTSVPAALPATTPATTATAPTVTKATP